MRARAEAGEHGQGRLRRLVTRTAVAACRRAGRGACWRVAAHCTADTPARRATGRVARFSALGQHAAVWLALGAGGSLVAALAAQRAALLARGDRQLVAAAYLGDTAVKLVVRWPRCRRSPACCR